MWDVGCKSWFSVFHLAKRLSAKTIFTSHRTISLQGTVLLTITVESACILKPTSSSSLWTIYKILILKQCEHGCSKPRGITCVIAGTVYQPQTFNDMAKLNHLETTLTSVGGKREWSEGWNPWHTTLFPWKLFSTYFWFCVILRGYFKDSTSLVC